MAKEPKKSGVAEITLEEAKEIIAQQEAVIIEMTEQLEKANLQKSDKPKFVSFGGKKYKINVPIFRLGDVVYKATDLETNMELQKELLALDGQSIITEI